MNNLPVRIEHEIKMMVFRTFRGEGPRWQGDYELAFLITGEGETATICALRSDGNLSTEVAEKTFARLYELGFRRVRWTRHNPDGSFLREVTRTLTDPAIQGLQISKQ